jgi:hypothetical protein
MNLEDCKEFDTSNGTLVHKNFIRSNICGSNEDGGVLICCTKPTPCLDSENKEGVCVSYHECPEIKKIVDAFKKDKHSISRAERLKVTNNKCSTGNKEHKVCCAKTANDLTTRKPPRTTRAKTEIPFQEVKVNTADTHQNEEIDVKTTSTTTTTTTSPSIAIEPAPNHEFLKKLSEILPKNCGGSQFADKILGGKETSMREHPWVISILDPNNEKTSICGGTLITKRYVLTAAHCLIPERRATHIRIGEWNFLTSPDCEYNDVTEINECNAKEKDVRINRWILHPDYRGSGSKHNDIALIRLSVPIDFNKPNSTLADAICLPLTSRDWNLNGESEKLDSVGWGITEASVKSNIKLKVELPLVSNENCSQAYKRLLNIIDSQLCAGGESGKIILLLTAIIQ